MPVVKTCRNCGTEFKVPPCRAKTAYTCSKACKYAMHPKINSAKCSCKQCGKEYFLPMSRIKRGNGVFCSRDCRHKHMSHTPEYSKRVSGDKNPMWKGGITMHSDGYVYERAPNHPLQSNGYVLQHRLILERRMQQECPGHTFLKDGVIPSSFHVHHRDEDRLNNDPENLMAMTGAAHRSWHNTGRLPEPDECWPNVHPGA